MRKVYLFLFIIFCLLYLYMVFFGIFPVSYLFGRWGVRGDGVFFVMLAPLLAVFLLFAKYYFKSEPVAKSSSEEEINLYFSRSSALYEQAVYDEEVVGKVEDDLDSQVNASGWGQVNTGGWEDLKYTVPGVELYFKDQESQSDRTAPDNSSPLVGDKESKR